MLKNITTAAVMLLILTLITGIIYPLGMTWLAQFLFPGQANGSMVAVDGKVIGSKLIGQNFTGSGYFHGRPSAAGVNGYDASASSGSNFGPTNRKFITTISERINNERQQNELLESTQVPSDLVLASASGLDPHITPAAAFVQVERVARNRGFSSSQVMAIVYEQIEHRQLGIFGESRINVLELNLALDRVKR